MRVDPSSYGTVGRKDESMLPDPADDGKFQIAVDGLIELMDDSTGREIDGASTGEAATVPKAGSRVDRHIHACQLGGADLRRRDRRLRIAVAPGRLKDATLKLASVTRVRWDGKWEPVQIRRLLV